MSALTAGANATAYATFPSAIASSTPVTVTVCGTFQFAVVKVSDAGETVPSAGLVLESAIGLAPAPVYVNVAASRAPAQRKAAPAAPMSAGPRKAER